MKHKSDLTTIVFDDGTKRTVSVGKARRHKRKGSDIRLYKHRKRMERMNYLEKIGGRIYRKYKENE